MAATIPLRPAKLWLSLDPFPQVPSISPYPIHNYSFQIPRRIDYFLLHHFDFDDHPGSIHRLWNRRPLVKNLPSTVHQTWVTKSSTPSWWMRGFNNLICQEASPNWIAMCGQYMAVHTPPKTNMAPKNHPFRKENDLNQTSIFGFHINLPGCISFSKTFLLYPCYKEIHRKISSTRNNLTLEIPHFRLVR